MPLATSIIPGPRYSDSHNHVVTTALFDVDNTLVPNDSRDLPSDDFRVATAKAKTQGIVIGLVSARPLSKTSHIMDYIAADSLSILCNGAQIVDSITKQVVAEWPIRLDTCNQAVSYLDSLAVDYWINDNGTDYFPATIQSRGNFERLSDIWDRSSPRVIVTGYQPTKPFVINIHNVTEDQSKTIEAFVINCNDPDVTTLIAHETTQADGSLLLDQFIVHKRANKQDALYELARLQNIPLSTVLAVGDGRNDAVLMTSAGIGVAMGNSAKETLAVATFIAPTLSEDGAAVALRHFAK